jgi:hypothetical protein
MHGVPPVDSGDDKEQDEADPKMSFRVESQCQYRKKYPLARNHPHHPRSHAHRARLISTMCCSGRTVPRELLGPATAATRLAGDGTWSIARRAATETPTPRPPTSIPIPELRLRFRALRKGIHSQPSPPPALVVISNDVVHSGLLGKNGRYHTFRSVREGAPSEASS